MVVGKHRAVRMKQPDSRKKKPPRQYSRVGQIYIIFAILENGHIAAEQVYFYKFNSKKTAKFSFSNNHRDIQN